VSYLIIHASDCLPAVLAEVRNVFMKLTLVFWLCFQSCTVKGAGPSKKIAKKNAAAAKMKHIERFGESLGGLDGQCLIDDSSLLVSNLLAILWCDTPSQTYPFTS